PLHEDAEEVALDHVAGYLMAATLDVKSSFTSGAGDPVTDREVSFAIELDATEAARAAKVVALDHDSRSVRGGDNAKAIAEAEDRKPSPLSAEHGSTALDADHASAVSNSVDDRYLCAGSGH